jgi:hypothetical protein
VSLFSYAETLTEIYLITISNYTCQKEKLQEIRFDFVKGAFNNYVDKILPFFDTCVGSFYTLSVDKNRHFLTSYPSHLVHVVIEWPKNSKKGRPFCEQ